MLNRYPNGTSVSARTKSREHPGNVYETSNWGFT
jgi:hypothetical protein